MADKKEYIERGALLAMCKRQIECEWNTLASPGTWAHAFEDFSDLVEQTTAADVVEVVRCKDCAWSRMIVVNGKPEYYCQCWNPGNVIHVNAHGFCVWGERDEQT